MKNLPWVFSIFILVAVVGLVLFGMLKIDLRANFTKCEESVIQSIVINNNGVPMDEAASQLKAAAAAGRCAYPSRLMRVKGVWVCSCRSEAETKRGIE